MRLHNYHHSINSNICNCSGLASAISTASNWLMAFIVIITFPLLKAYLGINVLLWIYSGICITGVAFVYLFVPETKGRTLEEIQQLF